MVICHHLAAREWPSLLVRRFCSWACCLLQTVLHLTPDCPNCQTAAAAACLPAPNSQIARKVKQSERKVCTYRKCKETSAKAPEAWTALVAVVRCPRRAEASRYTLSVLLRGDEISGALSLSCRRCGILRLTLRCVRELWRVRCGGSGSSDGATRGGARRGKAVRWRAGGAKGLSRGCC